MNKYIASFIETLKKIEITENDSTRYEYTEGVLRIEKTISSKKYSRGHIFFVGNGGSAAIASHMTADFMKNGGINTVSLYDNAVMTCMGNDYGYEFVFSKPLSFLSKENDVLIAISSSGKSKNILNAIEVIHKNGGRVITFTGFEEDNPVRNLGDINVYVPCRKYGIVESIHNLILQQIVDEITEGDDSFSL